MDSPHRVIVNTFAQYARTILNICLSLYSTRLVLEALGKSDYGLFALVGGVVMMLSFVTNAMVIATQRHLSYSFGQASLQELKSIFSNSLLLHVFISIGLILCLYLLTPVVFAFLKIAPDRMEAAHFVYYVTILTLFFSLFAAPYRALFIAHENIVFISVVDVLDGVLKVLLVLLLLQSRHDKLMLYTVMLSFVALFNWLVFVVYAKYHYKECCIIPHRRYYNFRVISKMFNFAGWSTYNTGCIVLRSQGLAVILNTFFGTLINSAYGIAMQVSNSTNFVAQSIVNALSPQVIKAEGDGKHDKMLMLAIQTCKYSYLLLLIVAIPLIVEMPDILAVWLGKTRVPDFAVMFCRFILIASVIDQLTIGLAIANQASGHIRNYSLIVTTTKILTLPIAWYCLYCNLPIVFTMWVYVGMETLSSMMRIPYLHYSADLSIRNYWELVIIRVVIPTVVVLCLCIGIASFFSFPFRFMITLSLSVLVGGMTIYYFALSVAERQYVHSLMSRVRTFIHIK